MIQYPEFLYISFRLSTELENIRTDTSIDIYNGCLDFKTEHKMNRLFMYVMD